MSTVLIIVIAVLVVLAIVMIFRRNIAERRRQAAAGLRSEAFDSEEKARRAEVEAGDHRDIAETRRARADRIDPDTDRGRNDESVDAPADVKERPADYDERAADVEDRPGDVEDRPVDVEDRRA